MTPDLLVLTGTAALIGTTHTLLGPDHYIPFVALSKARGWSMRRTMLVTFLCGVGHILSSVAIGLLGIYMGAELLRLTHLESVRGEIAGWLLLSFGIAYLVWGLRHAYHHRHPLPGHDHELRGRSLTPWTLFIIFAFGPCEPLIPLLMVPAAQSGMAAVGIISAVFGLVTIATMMGVVAVAFKGLGLLPHERLHRYAHALAGGAVTACAAGMVFLGW